MKNADVAFQLFVHCCISWYNENYNRHINQELCEK